jgi:predicted RNA binding protein YcfA (HicA-like mRNA interferase family)
MSRKQLEDCRTAREIVSYSECHGGYIKEGGSHTKIVGPTGGICPVPRHNGDLPSGTLRSIIRMLKLIGIIALVITVMVNIH